MGYWPHAELTYGLDVPNGVSVPDEISEEPEENGPKLFRQHNPANTCGLIRKPDGGLRVTGRYYSADGGRGGGPERIAGMALMPPASLDNELREAMEILIGEEKSAVHGVSSMDPDWLLTAETQ